MTTPRFSAVLNYLFVATAVTTGFHLLLVAKWEQHGAPISAEGYLPLLGSASLLFLPISRVSDTELSGELALAGCILSWLCYGATAYRTYVQLLGNFGSEIFWPWAPFLLPALLLALTTVEVVADFRPLRNNPVRHSRVVQATILYGTAALTLSWIVWLPWAIARGLLIGK